MRNKKNTFIVSLNEELGNNDIISRDYLSAFKQFSLPREIYLVSAYGLAEGVEFRLFVGSKGVMMQKTEAVELMEDFRFTNSSATSEIDQPVAVMNQVLQVGSPIKLGNYRANSNLDIGCTLEIINISGATKTFNVVLIFEIVHVEPNVSLYSRV